MDTIFTVHLKDAARTGPDRAQDPNPSSGPLSEPGGYSGAGSYWFETPQDGFKGGLSEKSLDSL
jgi:hypothetical protein